MGKGGVRSYLQSYSNMIYMVDEVTYGEGIVYPYQPKIEFFTSARIEDGTINKPIVTSYVPHNWVPLSETPLIPNKNYTVKIYSHNLYGGTLPSAPAGAYIYPSSSPYPYSIINNGYYSITPYNEALFTIATEPNLPSGLTFTSIGKTSVVVNWPTTGNNQRPNYILYKRVKSETPDPWEKIYEGTQEFFAVEGLESETKYEFLLTCTGLSNTVHTLPISYMQTSADPAVAAAVAAQSAAEKAMLESIETRTMTSEIKTEVQKIKEMLNKGQKDEIKPEIEVFEHAISKATITRQAVAPFALVATDNRSGILQYRYKLNNGEYSEWADLTSETVNIELGSAGLKRITAQVKDQAGNIATKTATIFKM